MKVAGLYLIAYLPVVLVSGCSSEKQVSVTCDIQSANVNTCTMGKVAASQSAAYQAACTSQGGKVGFDPCSRSGYFGICKDVSADGIEASVWSYPSGTVKTQEGAKTACANLGGSFETNPGYAEWSNGHCIGDQGCVEFPSLTTTDQVTNAQSYCTKYMFGTLSAGLCMISNATGVCSIVSGGIRAYLTDSPSTAAQECDLLGGVWTAN